MIYLKMAKYNVLVGISIIFHRALFEQALRKQVHFWKTNSIAQLQKWTSVVMMLNIQGLKPSWVQAQIPECQIVFLLHRQNFTHKIKS